MAVGSLLRLAVRGLLAIGSLLTVLGSRGRGADGVDGSLRLMLAVNLTKLGLAVGIGGAVVCETGADEEDFVDNGQDPVKTRLDMA